MEYIIMRYPDLDTDSVNHGGMHQGTCVGHGNPYRASVNKIVHYV